MTSITEKIDNIINERALLLSGKRSLEENLELTSLEKEFIFKFLSNSILENEGVFDLIALLAKELNHWTGAKFNKPNLLLSQENYSSALLTQLINASTGSGDGDIYLTSTQNDININSNWIKDNGLNSSNFSTGTFKTTYDGLVSDLTNLRAERLTPDGFGDYLHRDFYNNPYKLNIETKLTTLKNNLTSAKNSFTLLIENIVANIDNNNFLKNPDITDYVHVTYYDFSEDLDIFISEIQGMLDYLSPIGPSDDCSAQGSYNRATFDTFLDISNSSSSFSKLLEILDGISNRVDKLMLNFNGSINGNLREWYVFWIQLLIGRPQATIITLVGLQKALENNVDSLTNIKKQLELLFGDNYNKYLPTPEISSVFRDEENRVNLLVNSLPCFSKIKIYRKEIDLTESLKNNAYAEGTVIDEIEVLEPKLIFLDLTSVNSNSIYSYRVVIQDDGEIDSYYTGSQQSKVLENNVPFTLENSNTLILGEHNFSIGQNIYISDEGIFRIVGKTSTSILVDREVLANGNLKKVNGLLFT